MSLRVFSVLVFSLTCTGLSAQDAFTVTSDLRSEWMVFENGEFEKIGQSPFVNRNTVYFEITPADHPGRFVRLKSDRSFFVFINGKIWGEFAGEVLLNIDSLRDQNYSQRYQVAIHQKKINERALETQVIMKKQPVVAMVETQMKPYSDFRDFVVLAGLIIIFLFLAIFRLNRKAAADYFSIAGIFSSREADDAQSGARLTSSYHFQFYILCSLLIGFYLLIILYNLPPQYAMPIRFQASGFWMMSWQWIKLSAIIFSVFLLKITLIVSLTRLFGMRGIARFHFFNWIRLLLIFLGACTIILFMYFIARGDSANLFEVFLSMVIAAMVAWIVVAFFKLSGRTGHSMFHLFSYLCATEIIPLLITVKILFQ